MAKMKPAKIVPTPPPEWLSEVAKSIWNRAASDLARDGLYDPTFDDPLLNYVLAQAAIIEAAQRGEPPQAAILSQTRQLGISLFLDPESRRKALWLRRGE